MRKCKDCKFVEDGNDTIDFDKVRCTHPLSELVKTNYVDGEVEKVWPTCQESRQGKITNYCGCEGRLWEEK